MTEDDPLGPLDPGFAARFARDARRSPCRLSPRRRGSLYVGLSGPEVATMMPQYGRRNRSIFMTMKLFLAFVAIGAVAPTMAEIPPPSRSAAEVQTALSGYAAWLTKLSLVEQEAFTGLDRMASSWGRARGAQSANQAVAIVRPELARFKAALVATNVKLQALDKPDVVALKLAADLEPARLVQSYLDLNMQFSDVADSYGSFLVAMQRNDPQGMKRAEAGADRGLGLVLYSQAIMARAQQATVPSESSVYELSGFQADFYQAAALMFKATLAAGSGRDSELANQLILIADDCEHIATSGAAKQAREMEDYQKLRTQAKAAGQTDRVGLIDRRIAIAQVDSTTFPLSERFAKLLRAHAATLKSQPLTSNLANAMMASLRPYQEALGEVSGKENGAAMSNVQP